MLQPSRLQFRLPADRIALHPVEALRALRARRPAPSQRAAPKTRKVQVAAPGDLDLTLLLRSELFSDRTNMALVIARLKWMLPGYDIRVVA